jgi:fatty acid elongase 3
MQSITCTTFKPNNALGFVYFASWTYFTSTYFPSLPNLGRCAGEEFAAIAGICILSSYLLLFISFYAATYKKPLPKGRARAKSALKDMASEGVPTVPEAARRLSQSNGSVAPGFQASNEKNGATTRSRKA